MRGSTQWIVPIVAVVVLMPAPVEATAQQGAALIREGIGAYNDFDPQRALPLLRRGVDPNAGPRDSLWALGVQYLAQILYEQGDETGGRAWIRWAVRLAPGAKLDTLNLLSSVIAEFQRARSATAARPDDARVSAEWVWPSADPGSGPGRIELRPEGTPGVTVTVTGHGSVSPRLSLPAGSYEIEARAPGFRPVQITREVLPGVTTLLGFALQLEPPVAAAPQRPIPAPAPPPIAARKKGHFPWAIVVLGGLGVGAAAVLLGGGGGTPPPPTGGITVTIPDP
jgi:hypothetical protein